MKRLFLFKGRRTIRFTKIQKQNYCAHFSNQITVRFAVLKMSANVHCMTFNPRSKLYAKLYTEKLFLQNRSISRYLILQQNTTIASEHTHLHVEGTPTSYRLLPSEAFVSLNILLSMTTLTLLCT